MKKFLSILSAIIVIMAIMCVSAFAIDDAEYIALGEYCSGQITDSNTKDTYEFTLSSASRINIDLKAGIYKTDYYLYDANGNKVWSKTWQYWNDVTELYTMNENVDLTKGTYYFSVCKNSGTGDYNFKITAKSAGESFSETGFGTNNSIMTSNTIGFSKNYKGQIAVNDDKDIYKFTLDSSSRIDINLKAGIHKTDYYLYDANGNKIWSKTWQYWNDNTKQYQLNEIINLTRGTYYFSVCRNDGTGNYNFTITAKSAGENFSETGYGTNNEIANASPIKIRTKYNGQIAANDDTDIYKFVLKNSATIQINLVAGIYKTNYYLYDANGNEIWSKTWQYWNDNTKQYQLKETIDLAKGTYYFSVCRNEGTGNYVFAINCNHKYDNVYTYKCSVCGYTVKTPTLRKTGSVLYYYKNGVLDKSNTLVKYGEKLYHVKGGKYVQDTTLVNYGGKLLYVRNGIYTKATTLVNYGGKLLYVKNGVYTKATTLVNYGGKLLYAKNGVYTKATTLVKYGTKLYFIKNGAYTKATTLVNYGGKLLYVKNGIYTKATTLVNYGGKLLYIRNGIYTKATTLVKYGSKYYYVKNGVMNPKFSGKVRIGTKVYTIRKGAVI